MSKQILFIESDPELLDRWQRWLQTRVFFSETMVAGDFSQAGKLWEEVPFRAIILGQNFDSAEASAFLARYASTRPRCVALAFRNSKSSNAPIQFCGRPCLVLAANLDGDTFESAVRSALLLDEWNQNAQLKALSDRMTRLPSIPSLFVEVCQKLQSPDLSLEDVAVHISHDLAMCATLLRIVNSTAYGLSRQITTAFEAVMFLGASQTKSLILFSHLFSKFNGGKSRSFSMDEFWLHSVGAANIARWIAREETGDIAHGDEAYTAGLLHDVGRLLLADNMPAVTDKIAAVAKAQGWPNSKAEQETLGTTHAELGAYLLASWGLPYPILDAIGFHHNPQASSPDGFTILTAVHAANILDYEKRFDPASRTTKRADEAYLRSIFSDDPMIKWRSLAGITLSI